MTQPMGKERILADRRVWISLGLVAALVLSLGVYYWVHKPVAPAQAFALMGVMADASIAALLTLLGGGLGRRFIRGWTIASPGERIAVQAALGWGAIGLIMFGLGVAGLYYSVVIWVLALLALVLLWRDVRGWLADSFLAFKAMWPPDRLARLASLFVFFTLALGLLRALAPPLMWDALVYHLNLPKLYAQAHHLHLDVDILFTGMPQLTEMLYTAAILLRGEIAAQTLGWVFGAVLALGLAAHASELLEVRLSACAPAILFSALTIALALAWAYAEMLLMLIALALLIALRQWRMGTPGRWLWLGGILAGLAASCKYTGVLIPLAGVGLIVSQPLFGERRHLRMAMQDVVLFAGIAFIVFSPWLIKNWILTGSPTFPLLIPTRQMDALRQWFYSRPASGERNPLWAAAVFLRATFLGVQSANDYDATLGPLFVFLLLGLGVGWRRLESCIRDEARPLVVFALVSYAGWVLLTFTSAMMLQVRLFFAIFPALAILCAAGIRAVASFDSPSLRVSMILHAALVLVLSLSALENLVAFAARSPLAYLMGAQSATDYRAAALGTYVVAIDRVNALPAGSCVEFLWETRSLECSMSVRCEPDVVIDRWWHLHRTVGAASAVVSTWKAKGVTHVLINESGLSFVRSQADPAFVVSDWSELDALRSRMRLAANLDGAYSLYELP